MNQATSWILGIDLGNGGPKVAAVAPDGTILGTGFTGVSVHFGLDGSATQDAEEWTRALADAVAQALDSAGVSGDSLHAIGITGQWGSTVPVGADGEPVGPVLLWADTRAKPLMRDLVGGPLSVSGFAPHKVLPWVRVTGGAPTPSGADPTGHSLLLQNELADVGRRSRWLMEPVDYLAFRLTGHAAATPASMILSWLTDNRPGAKFGYDPDLVRRSRRDPRALPELLPTGSVQGELQPEIAERLGLRSGVPVVCGIPDVHAAIVGSGTVDPFATHLAISTTAWLSSRVPFKKTDVFHSIATVPGLDPELPLVANNIETGGAALAWLREQVIAPNDGLIGGGAGIGAEGAAPPRVEPSYEALMDLAGTAPAGSEGVIFAPWLAGERSPIEDKALRGTWLNLSLRTSRAILVRSVLEGVALNVRWLMEYYQKFIGREVPSVRIMGGGAQSDLWNAIISSTLDCRVEKVADPLNAQLRGVALWARVCLGELTLREAADLVPVEGVFEPDPHDRLVYAEKYREYRRLYGTLKGTYRRLNARA
ncbi:MAG: FGGY-family carbohydrate kinase [Candidatus Nanopelagicales bacterium]|nr:FGGY-family carbohydrate kinase [Candidatus Nanopelagicales bacterium]MDZ4249934.1 FGGY-family carbohydrate kinase [Candidatus Nanopelagicales bacterium]